MASRRPHPARFQAFDLLATLVAVVDDAGVVLFANAALEDAVGLSWRSIEGTALLAYFSDPAPLRHALEGVRGNEFAALRYDAQLKRSGNDRLPVQRLKGMLDGLLVIPLDRYANRQSDERKKHEQQHRAIGRGELSDGILPCAGSCHRCVNSSFHQFKHGQKHGLQFCSIGRKNQPVWRKAAIRALIDRH